MFFLKCAFQKISPTILPASMVFSGSRRPLRLCYSQVLPAKATPEPPNGPRKPIENFSPKRVIQRFTGTDQVMLLPNAAAKLPAVYPTNSPILPAHAASNALRKAMRPPAVVVYASAASKLTVYKNQEAIVSVSAASNGLRTPMR